MTKAAYIGAVLCTQLNHNLMQKKKEDILKMAMFNIQAFKFNSMLHN